MKRIIKTTALGIFAVAAVLTSGCTKKYYYDCDGSNGEQNRITLSSEVQFGVTPRLQDEQIVNGQSLSLFVTRTGSVADDDQVYLNNRITANGVGGFTYRVPMYYPSDGTNVDFYAIHPYSAIATLESPLSFSIQTDQRALVNYLNSDLLFGRQSNVSPQVNAIPLVFNHKLSKLNFVITTSNAGLDLNGLTEITIQGTMPQTTISVQDGSITAATGEVTPVQAYGDLLVTGNPGSQQATGYTAIIVPQQVLGAVPLFNLTVGGDPYVFIPTGNYTFDGGKKYTVTLDMATLTINLDDSQIIDWEDGGSIGGPAGPQ